MTSGPAPAPGARSAAPGAGERADAVRAAVLAVPGVVGLHPGRHGTVATYLPGRRVTGVRLGEDGAEVHVVVAAGADLRATAGAVHAAASAVLGAPVHVVLADLAEPTP
ncbi:hypothetical protein [Kineococcus gypseus]|uniref:hypothetical protein n=1 Tax=Kineococcus gypseus TaxID=1637102 RepID=UPI003D7E914D